jgi:hypothetical protein
VASLVTDHLSAEAAYWPLPYQALDGTSRYFLLALGATDDVEINASLESWDRNFFYNDGRFNVPFPGPTFNVDGKFSVGLGTKWAFHFNQFDHTFFALGARMHFYDNEERSFIEFHEYERRRPMSSMATPWSAT